jgi:hypothetical protein
VWIDNGVEIERASERENEEASRGEDVMHGMHALRVVSISTLLSSQPPTNPRAPLSPPINRPEFKDKLAGLI